ncbi:YbdD/YjiX family protein [Campylobacter sp. FMV-PI01]|uniref:YbdD/YjiX family protein n=1 Tax=Campylobacter portucalensis TaxID=2608384 RepID=A0A6L5WIB2_9BACT|nr:CstA-like transporter-associated (seleno)protein [Campylobacter portucalensis]MSN96869.1 YbdD/YjiX family protein [Campylobacter portucalensis]
MQINLVWVKIKNGYKNLDKALYPLIGLPSYEKYLEHFKKNHPDKTPLDRGEFIRQAQMDRAKNIKC